MLPFQLAGRNIQVLERFTPLGRLFSAASRTSAASLRRIWNQVKTGAPAGKPAFVPGRRIAQCAILTGALPWIGVPLSSMPFRFPTVSPILKFIRLTLKWQTTSGILSWLTSLLWVSQ
jgi:hypothetical protein